jgi:hypothetical protein
MKLRGGNHLSVGFGAKVIGFQIERHHPVSRTEVLPDGKSAKYATLGGVQECGTNMSFLANAYAR